MSPVIRIGTQGWNYDAWVGPFYPPGTRAADYLSVYARAFTTVEVDSTFYAIPAVKTVRGWAGRTPDGFKFALKLPQEISHENRLRESAAIAELFYDRARELGDKLGPILIQLPPNRPRDDGLLRLFQDSVDPELEYAWEFRHESWADVEVAVHANDLEADAPFRYLRLREPPYEDDALRALADRIRAQTVPVYCYFRHEDEPTAPRYAERLLEVLA